MSDVGTTIERRPFVQPHDEEPKSGCFWCPLLPWSADFEEVYANQGYNRDHEKILAKEPDGHTVRNRCVEEAKWTKVDVLFVGEAPGAHEDKNGVPFVGKSGSMLRNAIDALSHVTPEQCGIANTVRCRPPTNNKPSKTIVKSCSPRLIREIQARQPKVVVALGNIPLEFLTGYTGITLMNGKVLDCTVPELKGLKVVACIHPAYVLRFDHEMEHFLEAMETMQDVLTGEYEPKAGPGEYYTLTDIEEIEDVLQAFIEGDGPVAVDTETGHLDWFDTTFPQLLCFSFTDEEGFGYTIPYDHAESPFRKRSKYRKRLRAALREFFESPVPKVLQNGKFDDKHIRSKIGCRINNYEDTMLTHLVIDERRGTHGLKQQSHAFTGMGGYERALERYIDKHPEANPERGGSYSAIPGKILFEYAGMDADATLRNHNAMIVEDELAQNEQLQGIAFDFLPSLSEALGDIEYQGAQIDKKVVAEMDRYYSKIMDETRAQIADLQTVRDYVAWRVERGKEAEFNPASTPQLQQLLFGWYGEKPCDLTDGGQKRITNRWNRAVVEWRKTKRGRKPGFQRFIRDAIEKKEWQHFSTKADVLHELDRRGNELAELILKFRSAETLHGTFVEPLKRRLDKYGRIHGNFMIYGTSTGRLASNGPNLQNIPNKGGGRIKRAYVSRFGAEGLIGQVDYSQIELRVAASWFNEPTMIRAYREGADVHTLTAIDISRLTPEEYHALSDYEQKEWRVRAKRINFGILYGGGPSALQNALQKEGVFLTTDECVELIERYFEVRPALRAGIERLEQEVCTKGFLESFTGRRRRLPEVFSESYEIVSRALRQSVNFPIQNGASEMTLMALVLIWREMKRRKYRSKIILTVHDSIIFDLHVDEAFEVMAMAKDIMERLPELSDQVLPGLDWSWLQCPIVADVEVGPSWQSLVGYDSDTILEGLTSEEPLWAWSEKKDKWVPTRTPINIDELWEVMEEKAAA